MIIYLLRHGHGEARSRSNGDDGLRPLSEKGRAQALAVAASLGSVRDRAPARIVSAPALRCQQSVAPLAETLGVEVEVDERLAKGESAARALELFERDDDERPLLLCTHSDVIGGVLTALELVDSEPECRKGAFWILEGTPSPRSARYFEPGHRPPKEEGPASAAESATVRAAALDMGSTSFHLLIADVSPAGEIVPVVRDKVMLRIGAVVKKGAAIPEEICERAVEVAADLHALAKREKVEHFIPVATAALRDASNGQQIAARLSAVLSTPVRILSGEQEARVIFRAFQARYELDDFAVLGADLGGGSLELVVGNRAGVMDEVTLPLGVVRLHGEMVTNDPIGKSEVKALRRRVRDELAPVKERLTRNVGQGHCIAAGGTARALSRLVDASPGEPAAELSAEQLADLRDRLIVSSHAERLAMRGMRKGRADLVPTGAIILDTLVAEFALSGLRICDWGLREGVLLDALCPQD